MRLTGKADHVITTEKLLAHGKFITQERDYSLFHSTIEEIVASGLLKPVKASGSNGRIPLLYNKYRIIKPRIVIKEANLFR